VRNKFTSSQHRFPVKSQCVEIGDVGFDGVLSELSRVDHADPEEQNGYRKLDLSA
jgi:hypothetical protein